MLRNLVFIMFFSVNISCGQNGERKSIDGLTIDPKIKESVENAIEYSKELDGFGDIMEVYLNSGDVSYYEHDSLLVKTEFGERQIPFKSFYLWHGDTLLIDGAFGLFGGNGFDIKLYENKAVLSHMLSSDDFPSYAYHENAPLINRLEVPCSDTKIVLSEIPDSLNTPIIYGYVEFKSGTYYATSGSVDGKEILPRQKLRSDMKLYFKSGHLKL